MLSFCTFLEDFICYKRAYLYFNLRHFKILFNFKPIVNLQKKRAQRVPIYHNLPQSALLHKYDVKNQITEPDTMLFSTYSPYSKCTHFSINIFHIIPCTRSNTRYERYLKSHISVPSAGIESSSLSSSFKTLTFFKSTGHFYRMFLNLSFSMFPHAKIQIMLLVFWLRPS